MLSFRAIIILFAVIATLTCADCARILGVFPIAGMSHYILASKLMVGLAEAGHDVTMVSPYPLKNPPKNGRFTDVVLDGFAEEYLKMIGLFNVLEFDNMGFVEKMQVGIYFAFRLTNESMYHPKLRELAASNQQFDAVIMEQFTMDAHKVYAHIFNSSLIVLSSMGPNSYVNPLVGNPEPLSYSPSIIAGDFSKDLSFSNRMKSLLGYSVELFMKTFYMLPQQEDIMRQLYPQAPPLVDLYYNVSLVLLNSHVSLYPALPLVPNMVEIGGYFIDPPKKLPDDLQQFLDNAKEGVVYFSMGSNVNSKDFSEEKKKIILNVLRKLKEKVIWKFEEDLPEKPDNVMIRKWCPQQDILAHPNVKLFITHGGLLSTTEEIYHGVPILAVPVFGDQPANADRAVAGGYGLKLAYHDPDFTEEKLGSLLNELLTDQQYRETIKEKSKIYHDRPMKPLDTATYWVDYVIRHRGAPHLRVAGLKLPWYKYFIIDGISLLVAVFVLVLLILRYLFKKLCCKKSATFSQKLKSQ